MDIFTQIWNWFLSLITPAAWISLFGLLFGLTGCSANATQEQQIELFRQGVLAMKELGVAGQANLHIGGSPAFDFRTGGVLSTDVSGNISIQLNAEAEPRGKAETAVGDATMKDTTPVDGASVTE